MSHFSNLRSVLPRAQSKSKNVQNTMKMMRMIILHTKYMNPVNQLMKPFLTLSIYL